MTVQVGDVFWLECEYDDIDFSEERPVVVIDLDADGNAVVAVVTEITSQLPNDLENGYGRYRTPLFKWREIGLKKPSYAKANKTARVCGCRRLEKAYWTHGFTGRRNGLQIRA
jgi:mRNA interferase MazF